MKKEYKNPTLKEVSISEEPLLISVSTGEGNPSIDIDDEDGDVDDALGKPGFWDE